MGINKIDGIHQTTGGLLGKQIFAVKVGKILLDGSTDEAAAYGGYDALGMIFWTRTQDKKSKTIENVAQDEKNIEGRFDGTAKPLFPFIKYYPLINEVVLIISSVSKNAIDHSVKDTETYYLPNINIWNHPHHNNFPALQNYTDAGLKKNEDYQKAGLLRRITDAEKEYDIPLGDYFREQLKNTDNVIGSFDVVNGEYNIMISTAAKFMADGSSNPPETISFNEQGKGWVSFKSFIPSYGFSVSGKYYTTFRHAVYQHYTNNTRNNFYGTQYESEIEIMFGDSPDTIKSFKTVNYEGSQSKITAYTGSTESYGAFTDGLTVDVNDNEYYNLTDKTGWYVNSFKTDLQQGNVTEFIQKENKWFNKINGIETDLTDTENSYNNFSEFATQGIGFPVGVTSTGPTEARLIIKDSLDGLTGGNAVIEGDADEGGLDYFYGDDDL